MSNDLTAEIDAAVAVAREAATLIASRRNTVTPDVIREKGRHDLVTEVDLLSQSLIVGTLSEAFPEYGFLAEEESEDEIRVDTKRRWVIDPVDGTTNFTHDVPPFAVSIALLDGNAPVVGVVVEVVSGETFTAVRGQGSYLNGDRMRVSDTASLDASLISTGFPYRSVQHVDSYLQVLRTFMVSCRGVRRHGSAAIDLAYLAAGRFDGFFETGLMPWDVAAGILLIQEAGGIVSAFTKDADPLFDGQILATNSRIHDAMIEDVRPLADVFG